MSKNLYLLFRWLYKRILLLFDGEKNEKPVWLKLLFKLGLPAPLCFFSDFDYDSVKVELWSFRFLWFSKWFYFSKMALSSLDFCIQMVEWVDESWIIKYRWGLWWLVFLDCLMLFSIIWNFSTINRNLDFR